MNSTLAFFVVATILLHANARPADEAEKAAEAMKAASETAMKSFGASTPATTFAPAATPAAAPATAPTSAPATPPNPIAEFEQTVARAPSEFAQFAQSFFNGMQMG